MNRQVQTFDRALAAILRERGPAGEIARKMLPLAIMIPILVGAVRLWGEKAGLYGTEAGVALMVVANVAVTFGLLVTSIFALHRSDGDRVEREQALALSENQYRLAESIAGVGHWQLDVATDTLEWSEEMTRIHGFPTSAEAPSTQVGLKAFHPDDQRMINRLTREAVRQGEDYECGARIIRPDGELREIRLHCTCRKDSEGRVFALFGVVADVTELARARRVAEEATAAKSSFLAHMSHEIRTPMNGVMGFAELLTNANLPPEQHRHATLVHDSAKSLLNILNDILDIAKVDAGHFQLNEQPASLKHLIKQCVGLMGAAASAKGLSLEMTIDPGVPEALVLDDLRVRQIILNLLGNAIKFTDHGFVAVDVAVVAGPGGAMLEIRIRDSGVGISEERQGAIFEDFSQADSTISRRFGGTGLGLSISRRLTELMSGTLAIASKLGEGTTVTLSLPCRPADRVPGESGPSPADAKPGGRAASPTSVLVVEDLAINQELIVAMLARMGHHADLAANGEEALGFMQRHDDGLADYRLVLMDVQMPVMDGLTATRAIRARPGRSARLPIVALTANAFPADIAACEAAGMNGHLTKPFTIADLSALMGQWSASEEVEEASLAS